MKQRIAFIHVIMVVTIINNQYNYFKNYSESPVTHPSLMSQPVFFLGSGVKEEGRGKKQSGPTCQLFVTSAGMLLEPIRLQ